MPTSVAGVSEKSPAQTKEPIVSVGGGGVSAIVGPGGGGADVANMAPTTAVVRAKAATRVETNTLSNFLETAHPVHDVISGGSF